MKADFWLVLGLLAILAWLVFAPSVLSQDPPEVREAFYIVNEKDPKELERRIALLAQTHKTCDIQGMTYSMLAGRVWVGVKCVTE